MEGIKNDIKTFREHGVKHISTYSLMIEEGTAFYDRYNTTIEEYISPETEREMYHGTRAFLNELGYETYEISNSAMPGFKSIHNSSYWNSCEYFAIGAGAHGFLGDLRYGHRDDVRAYIEEMNTITSDGYKAFLDGNKNDLKSLYIDFAFYPDNSQGLFLFALSRNRSFSYLLFRKKEKSRTLPNPALAFLYLWKNYFVISDTTPEATVLPPSRIANRNPVSIAIG